MPVSSRQRQHERVSGALCYAVRTAVKSPGRRTQPAPSSPCGAAVLRTASLATSVVLPLVTAASQVRV